ncbi:MAG: phage Gp37/Gp68 family protein [Parvibaculaceae bacterium]|nr:phage Gp37/Gp68 family protein [Parvibaculaceae bacterium]
MSDKTMIEWTDATWNPIVGCSVISPGCTNCYAMKLAGTRLKNHPTRQALTDESKAGPVWNGEVRFNEKELLKPLSWKRPRKIFVCAHSDLFQDAVPDEWIDKIFAIMALCPQHTFQVLTKRPERMRKYMRDELVTCRWQLAAFMHHQKEFQAGECVFGSISVDEHDEWHVPMPLPNVWLGVSVEDQTRADERIPILLATRAVKRFVSAEPLLGSLDLKFNWDHCDLCGGTGMLARWPKGRCDICGGKGKVLINGQPNARGYRRIDWVIVGGESGKNARPMHPDWVRSLRDQCKAARVPFFMKQWGEWAPGIASSDGETVRFSFSNPDLSACLPGGCSTPSCEPSDAETQVFFEHFHEWGDVIDEGETIAAYRVGKKKAGALLDGVEHREFPA